MPKITRISDWGLDCYTSEQEGEPTSLIVCEADGWVANQGAAPTWLRGGHYVEVHLRCEPDAKDAGPAMPVQTWRWSIDEAHPDEGDIIKFRPVLEEKHRPFAEALAPMLTSRGDRPAFPPDVKPTNPKDAVAGTKVPLDLLSPVAMAHWAAGQHAGNSKYGLVNYRVCGASARVYLGGAMRHIQRYLAGERLDLQDGAHNLGMAMANLAIVLDCEAAGTLTDDRPYPIPLDATYREVEEIVMASNARYKDRKPEHYTMAKWAAEQERKATRVPEAAQSPALSPWVPYAGGGRPAGLAATARVDVQLRNLKVMHNSAAEWLDWNVFEDNPDDSDIRAWRYTE